MAAASRWRTPTPASTLHPGHGAKRRADKPLDDADGDAAAQRLAKRFHLLNIENNGRLWVDPNNNDATSHGARDPQSQTDNAHTAGMQVEDTPHRVYIHNLDEELAEAAADSDEERLVFIPDIDRKLNKIPLHVLMGDSLRRTGNELILYEVPKALSVPEDKDSVRKAILESRARARHELEAASPSRDALLHEDAPELLDSQELQAEKNAVDEDAMDIG